MFGSSDPVVADTYRYLYSLPEPIYECECCGHGVYKGEEYFTINNKLYCMDCLNVEIAGDEDE